MIINIEDDKRHDGNYDGSKENEDRGKDKCYCELNFDGFDNNNHEMIILMNDGNEKAKRSSIVESLVGNIARFWN